MSKTLTFDPELLERLAHFNQQHQLITKNQTVLVGFSGGPDSLFLLHWLQKLQSDLQLSLIALHLDHGWRKDSSKDARWCQQVAHDLGITFISEKADAKTLYKNTGSQEDQGRRLRREFFNRNAQQHDNPVIALGHHADDQQETFFIRLLRGAGVTGLAGIQPRDGIIIHPLLCTTKQEIVTTLENNDIHYLIDPTNESNQYLRNRIRMNVIPALRQCDARFDESLTRTMENLRATDDFIQEHTHTVFKELSEESSTHLVVDYQKILVQHPFLQKQLLLHWLIAANVQFSPSQALFDEITRFLCNTKSNVHTFYQSWKIVKKGNGQCYIEKSM